MRAIRLIGDFGKFEALIRRVEALSAGGLKDLTISLGAEALRLIDEGFAKARDPYGKAWAPIKHRQGQILRDTGRLKNSLTSSLEVSTSGFQLGSSVRYAAIHQFGGKVRIPARQAVLAFGRRGRFISHRAARNARKLRLAVVALIPAHEITIPRRQFIPEKTLGPEWSSAFLEAASDFLRKRLLK